jgi:hypothetical protein
MNAAYQGHADIIQYEHIQSQLHSQLYHIHCYILVISNVCGMSFSSDLLN